MKTASLPEPDLKDEIIRMLHPRWHLARAYYLVEKRRLSYQQVAEILGRSAGWRWDGRPYHVSTIRGYVKKGQDEFALCKGPLWRLSEAARAYLRKREGIDLLKDDAVTRIRAFIGRYSVRKMPWGCGFRIWNELVDAVK